MIVIDNIGNLKKCRVWLEKLTSLEYKSKEIITTHLEEVNYFDSIDQNIAVELFIAPRYYAFLGMEYTCKKNNKLEIVINISENSNHIINDKLALPSDIVFSGISSEYAQRIMDISKKVLVDLNIIPSGCITFNVGGYSEYGSNQIIISKVTSIVIRLFLENIKSNCEIYKIKNIVRSEVEKPLTEI